MAITGVTLPNDFEGHLRNWLAQRAGYVMPDRRVPLTFGQAMSGGASNRAFSGRDEIQYNEGERGQLEALSSRYGRRGRIDPEMQRGLNLMLHELFHQPLMQREPKWYGEASPDNRLWEEAAAEQGARDVLPAAIKQLFGSHWDPRSYGVGFQYEPRVKAYQQLSVFGSGAGKHQDRAARLWRRKYQQSDTNTRRQMHDAAMAKRQAWGQETGR